MSEHVVFEPDVTLVRRHGRWVAHHAGLSMTVARRADEMPGQIGGWELDRRQKAVLAKGYRHTLAPDAIEELAAQGYRRYLRRVTVPDSTVRTHTAPAEYTANSARAELAELRARVERLERERSN